MKCSYIHTVLHLTVLIYKSVNMHAGRLALLDAQQNSHHSVSPWCNASQSSHKARTNVFYPQHCQPMCSASGIVVVSTHAEPTQ